MLKAWCRRLCAHCAVGQGRARQGKRERGKAKRRATPFLAAFAAARGGMVENPIRRGALWRHGADQRAIWLHPVSARLHTASALHLAKAAHCLRVYWTQYAATPCGEKPMTRFEKVVGGLEPPKQGTRSRTKLSPGSSFGTRVCAERVCTATSEQERQGPHAPSSSLFQNPLPFCFWSASKPVSSAWVHSRSVAPAAGAPRDLQPAFRRWHPKTSPGSPLL